MLLSCFDLLLAVAIPQKSAEAVSQLVFMVVVELLIQALVFDLVDSAPVPARFGLVGFGDHTVDLDDDFSPCFLPLIPCRPFEGPVTESDEQSSSSVLTFSEEVLSGSVTDDVESVFLERAGDGHFE
jgi:hypothetical protein